MKASVNDLRFHSSELLDVVAKGEEVIITYRGKPCAKLVPLDEKPSEENDELFAMWSDHKSTDVDDFVRNQRKPRVSPE